MCRIISKRVPGEISGGMNRRTSEEVHEMFSSRRILEEIVEGISTEMFKGTLEKFPNKFMVEFLEQSVKDIPKETHEKFLKRERES